MVQPRRVRFVQRLPAPVLIAVAVIGIVALVLLGIASAGEDDEDPDDLLTTSTTVSEPVPAPPGGVRATSHEPDELGVTLQLPSTWEAGDGEEGYEVTYESPDGERFVYVDRRPITQGRGRVDELRRLGATIGGERTTEVAGLDAQVVTYEAPFPGRGIGTATELDLDLGDGTFAIVVVAGLEGSADEALTDWIVATVRPAPAP